MKRFDAYLFTGITFLMALLFACNSPGGSTAVTAQPLLQPQKIIFDKLAGTWQNEADHIFERWLKDKDGSYQSASYSVKGNDTTWHEQARIYKENKRWIFENTVKGQNNDKPVRFFASQINENSVQFSNPAHDFPTDIRYTIIDANTLEAFITGPGKKGGKDTIPFHFKRVN